MEPPSSTKGVMSLARAQDRAAAVNVLDRTDARWLRLREIVRAHSLKMGEFVLSSGRFFLILPALAGKGSHFNSIAAPCKLWCERMIHNKIRCGPLESLSQRVIVLTRIDRGAGQ